LDEAPVAVDKSDHIHRNRNDSVTTGVAFSRGFEDHSKGSEHKGTKLSTGLGIFDEEQPTGSNLDLCIGRHECKE